MNIKLFNLTLSQLSDTLTRAQHLLPPALSEIDWCAHAYTWRVHHGVGFLRPIAQPRPQHADDLLAIERQKTALLRNTEQFVHGLPANHVLLTGARGTGKSSLIRAALQQFAAQGLRVIEVARDDLHHLPDIVDLVRARVERYIVYCDDLTFETSDVGYKALKTVLDGSFTGYADNVLVYATSNRRHLIPEYSQDNQGYSHPSDYELHPSEAVEEKIALSERFGLWLSFKPFKQDEYLDIVAHALAQLNYTTPPEAIDALRTAALQFTLERGARSARVAQHFARQWVGAQRLHALRAQS